MHQHISSNPLRLLILLATMLWSLAVHAAPDWLRQGTLAAFDVYLGISDSELNAELDAARERNVSVLEIDTRLSEYLNDTEFAAEVAFIDRVARGAEERGMHSVIYIPGLEVLTQNGVNLSSTMFRDHPEWIQRGIDGSANVFYGNQEVWVDADAESAWMSPNTGYRDYFIDRIEQLAATAVDGIWVDVPIYLETGAGWAGAEPAAAADFNAWSIAEGLGGPSGYTVPSDVDFDDPGFRAWVRWRHINLAGFLDAVRAAAQAVNPEMLVLVENFPMDYMDATKAGLDGAVLVEHPNLIPVWELDSVSNTTAMQWSNTDDFENKIAMLKWGTGVQADAPSLSFSYGNEPLDAGLTMAAVVASGSTPFEAKTPDMTQSVGAQFRTRWFGYVREHAPSLLQATRRADAGVWYSGTTRDFIDFPTGGEYGMYTDYTPPTDDPAWWSTHPDDSAAIKPHLGAYRGISAALTRLQIPYTVINEARVDSARLAPLSLLMLPSVVAMSNQEAALIADFVSAGGTVIATGAAPAMRDEWGGRRAASALDDVFGFDGDSTPADSDNAYGAGMAIFRSGIDANGVFGQTEDATEAQRLMSEIEPLVRSHVDNWISIDNAEAIYVEAGISSPGQHHLYLVNYRGLQQPLISDPQTVTVRYQAPEGTRITAAVPSSPDTVDNLPPVNLFDEGNGIFRMEVRVDQFTMVDLTLADTSEETPPLQETAFVDGVLVNTGRFDFGTLASLQRDDTDTYDIDSAPVPAGHQVDWETSTRLLETNDITELRVVLSGHYSLSGIDQRSFLFNVATGDWDQFDRRFISGGDDIIVTMNAPEPDNYIDADGVVRLRVRADLAAQPFTSWANSITTVATRSDTLPPVQGDGISNPAAGIALDGDLSDWSAYTSFAEDPDDVFGADDPLDWRRGWMAHDGQSLYIAYENDAPIASSWGQTLYLDTDQNSATGFGNGLPIGADHVLQGPYLYRYIGQGSDWVWEFVTRAENGASPQQFEFALPLAALNAPQALDVAFVGANEAYDGGTVEDFYPDGVYERSSEERFFTYRVAAVSNSAPVATSQELLTQVDTALGLRLSAIDVDNDELTFSIVTPPANGTLSGTPPQLSYEPLEQFVGLDTFTFVANDGEFDSGLATISVQVQTPEEQSPVSNPVESLVVDGSLNDWSGLRAFPADPQDILGDDNLIDYRQALVAHDAANLYLGVEIDSGELASVPAWGLNLYLDTDSNAATGFRSGWSIGADFLQQGQALFRYTGDGISWSWEYLTSLPRAANGTSAELSLSRLAIGNPLRLRLHLIGDNLSIGGSLEDLYPDGVYDDDSVNRYLEYDFGSVLEGTLEPVLGLAVGDNAPVAENGRIALFTNAQQPSSARAVAEVATAVRGGGVLSPILLLLVIGLLVFWQWRQRSLFPSRPSDQSQPVCRSDESDADRQIGK